MKIYGIKSKEVMACAGSWAVLAEAAVNDERDGDVFVTVQEYDTLEFTVTKKSIYSYLAEDGKEQADWEFLEEYTSYKASQESRYAEVFRMLKGIMKKLG